MTTRDHDADVIVVGGGPAGAALAGLLAGDGIETVVLERGVHPGAHVGEALAPSTNLVFERLGLFDKLDDAGFVRRIGTAWNDPRAPLGTFTEIGLFGPPARGPRSFTYHVERDELDTIMLRHAHERGAKVLQGVEARRVLFRDGAAVGVHAHVAEGWERDLFAKVVVDASGGRDPFVGRPGPEPPRSTLDDSAVHATFVDVEAPPEGLDGCTLIYPLGSSGSWAWQIPLKNGRTSIGVHVGDEDPESAGGDPEATFSALLARNATLADAMDEARQVRPFEVGAARPSGTDRLAGPGWIVVGDALRTVDPIFLSGLDLALFSSIHAAEAIVETFGAADPEPFTRYEARITTGVAVRRELTSALTERNAVLEARAIGERHREQVVGASHGDPYRTETHASIRALLEDVRTSREEPVARP